MFSVTDFLETKRLGKTHPPGAITSFIQSFHRNEVADYQMSAWMMAVCINKNSPAETAELTKAMIGSGLIADYSDVLPSSVTKVDKHSTGGVGDKTSIILAPLLASLDVFVPMMSGRGLGHTGGTLDKLESITNFKTMLEMEEFKGILQKVKCAMVAAGKSMAPVDKRMYALRDVTSTVPSLSLITGSIMCKKLAENPDALVLDVKVGKGAFMKTTEEAIELAQSMVSTGERNGKPTVGFITRMDEPLGEAVGNFFEIRECVKIMKNEHDKHLSEDLYELTVTLAGQMCVLGKKCDTLGEGIAMARVNLSNGKALDKFYEMVIAQGGEIECVTSNLDNYPPAKFSADVVSDRNGVVSSIDALVIGNTCVELGAGRRVASDSVEMNCGIFMCKKVGDSVNVGDVVARCYSNREGIEDAARRVFSSFAIDQAQDGGEKKKSLITHIISCDGVTDFK